MPTRPSFGPSRRLDIELELGFVVGVPSTLGEPVPTAAFRDHVFGVVLVNDWSARDIQAWEYVPLGPFLGKSFATSVSAWVTPLALLEDRRVPAPEQDPEPLPHLRVEGDWAFDIPLEVELNGTVVSQGNARGLYWTMPQQLAHATSNGASIRTGDLMASGTISGSERGSEGSLIELTWNGQEPLKLGDGSERTFLEDGDEVVLRGDPLGEVRGRILGAQCLRHTQGVSSITCTSASPTSQASRRFYEAALNSLGLELRGGDDSFASDELYVSADGEPTTGMHLAFQAADQDAVHRFYEAALAAGGRDNGAPGERSYHPGYYAAYVLDPDGNNIEAVYHGPFERSAPSVVFTWDEPE